MKSKGKEEAQPALVPAPDPKPIIETNLELFDKADKALITDGATRKAAFEIVSEINKRIDQVQSIFEEPKGSAYKVHRFICAAENKALEGLFEARKLLLARDAAFVEECKGKLGGMEIPMPDGFFVRSTQKIEVTDSPTFIMWCVAEKQYQYLAPDMGTIKAAVEYGCTFPSVTVKTERVVMERRDSDVG